MVTRVLQQWEIPLTGGRQRKLTALARDVVLTNLDVISPPAVQPLRSFYRRCPGENRRLVVNGGRSGAKHVALRDFHLRCRLGDHRRLVRGASGFIAYYGARILGQKCWIRATRKDWRLIVTQGDDPSAVRELCGRLGVEIPARVARMLWPVEKRESLALRMDWRRFLQWASNRGESVVFRPPTLGDGSLERLARADATVTLENGGATVWVHRGGALHPVAALLGPCPAEVMVSSWGDVRFHHREVQATWAHGELALSCPAGKGGLKRYLGLLAAEAGKTGLSPKEYNGTGPGNG